MRARFVVITGSSGGGKSTLLAELRRRGHAVVEEPGRRIVKDEVASGGSALPWIDLAAFGGRAVTLAMNDRAGADPDAAWTFFDRGVVDAAGAVEHATGEPLFRTLGEAHRYHGSVFFAPPWPEIYVNDPERRHSFEAAQTETEWLIDAYTLLGYRLIFLPKAEVAQRADFVLSHLEE